MDANPIPPSPEIKNKRILDIEQEIEDFKARIRQMKQELDEQQKEFTAEMIDIEYRTMLEKSGFTIDEFDLSHYPFWVPPHHREEAKNRLRVEDPDYPTIDWKKISTKVYLKAFTDEEVSHELEKRRASAQKQRQNNNAGIEARTRALLEERQKDFEEFIGQDVISKVGMLIFSLGLALMLRYGIESGVVSEEIRTLIAVGIAGLFLFGAHKLKERNVTFSILFVMAGVALLFYTTYLAHYYYGMLSQMNAFLLNVVITGISLVFALYHHRISLAIFALLGAYATPFILSTGNDDYNVFFGYMLAINSVMMLVAYRKMWLSLNQIVFVLTLLIFGAWLNRSDFADPQIFSSAFIFGTLFYLSFFVMMIINSIRIDIEFGERDYAIFFINTAFYFISVYLLLQEQGLLTQNIGIFGIGLGIFNAAFAAILYHQEAKEERLFTFLIATAVVFVTVLAPSFVGSNAALNRFWLLESLLLLWLARLSRNQVLRDASAIVMFMGIFMLGMVWFNYYLSVATTLFFNEAVFTGFFTVTVIGVSIALILGKGKDQMVLTSTAETYAGVIGGLAGLIFYSIGNLELTMHQYTSTGLARVHIGILNTTLILVVWIGANFGVKEKSKRIADYLLILVLYSYIAVTHFSVVSLRNNYLMGNEAFLAFGTHYINFFLALLSIFLLFRRFYVRRRDKYAPRFDYFLWLVVGAFVFHISAETDHFVVLSMYDSATSLEEILTNAHRTLYILLWAACAFVFMLLGMKYQYRELRMISLALFAVTLGKFFLFDFPNLSIFAKMLSLIVIGGLMLIVSFLYTHLKGMIEEGTFDWKAVAESLSGKATPPKEESDNENN